MGVCARNACLCDEYTCLVPCLEILHACVTVDVDRRPPLLDISMVSEYYEFVAD